MKQATITQHRQTRATSIAYSQTHLNPCYDYDYNGTYNAPLTTTTLTGGALQSHDMCRP